jgi:hypothetical protein
MATDVIPTQTSLLFWNQTTTLDGVPYLLTFQYNTREACYYLMIQSSDATILYAQGIKIVSNYPLLGFGLYAGWAGPPGDIMCISQSTADDSPPELGEMGDGQRCVLLYMEEADVIAGESWRNPDGVEGLN